MTKYSVTIEFTLPDQDADIVSIVPDVIRSRFFGTAVHVDKITVIKEPS